MLEEARVVAHPFGEGTLYRSQYGVFLYNRKRGALVTEQNSYVIEENDPRLIGDLSEGCFLLNFGVWRPREVGSLIGFPDFRMGGRVVDGFLIGAKTLTTGIDTAWGVFDLEDLANPRLVEPSEVRLDVEGISSQGILVRRDLTEWCILDRLTREPVASWQDPVGGASEIVGIEHGIIEYMPTPAFRSWETGEVLWDLESRSSREFPRRQFIEGDGCLGEFCHDKGTRWKFYVIDPQSGETLSTTEGEWADAGKYGLCGLVPYGDSAFLAIGQNSVLHFSW